MILRSGQPEEGGRGLGGLGNEVKAISERETATSHVVFFLHFFLGDGQTNICEIFLQIAFVFQPGW